jgi:hypothetical protein
VNDADRLGRDPAMRWIVGGKAVSHGAVSTSQMGRFETELLATDANLAAVTNLSGIWIDRVHDRKPPKAIVLDMDSSVSPTYGEQEGTAYNGHFGCTCYHPLFVFNQYGDLERCALRPGNVHSADDWRDVLEPVVARYEFLEAEGFKYAIRLPANKVLQDSIAHLLKRPVGRPPKDVRRYHANFSYRAASWTKRRRVVAKVEWHPGELYPRVGFVVTNLFRPAERVVAFYNQRGTAEQWIKEGKNAVRWTRLSCRRFRHNAVRLQLHALAYNLGNFLRTGLARCRRAVVADDAPAEAGQDRREDRAPRTLRHVSDGRGRDPPRPVRRHHAPYRPAQTDARSSMTSGILYLRAADRTGATRSREEGRVAPRIGHLAITTTRERPEDGNRLRTQPYRVSINPSREVHLGNIGLEPLFNPQNQSFRRGCQR